MEYRIVIESEDRTKPSEIHRPSFHACFGDLQAQYNEYDLTLLLTPRSGGCFSFDYTFPHIVLDNFFPIQLRRATNWINGVVPYIIMNTDESLDEELSQLNHLITQAAGFISAEFPKIQFRPVQPNDIKCVLFRFPTIYEDYNKSDHPFPFGCPRDQDTLTVYVPKVLDYSPITNCLGPHLNVIPGIVNHVLDYYKPTVGRIHEVCSDENPKIKCSKTSYSSDVKTTNSLSSTSTSTTSSTIVDLQYITGQLLEILGINLNANDTNEYQVSPDVKTNKLNSSHARALKNVCEYNPSQPIDTSHTDTHNYAHNYAVNSRLHRRL